MPRVRPATHAGSWYSADGGALRSSFDAWLADAAADPDTAAAVAAGAVRAVIGPCVAGVGRGVGGGKGEDGAARSTHPLPPLFFLSTSHAGYSYCGPIMAHAYAAVAAAAEGTARVVLLGPSHKVATRAAHLSSASAYATPLGDLVVDTDAIAALRATGAFDGMGADADAAEHSLELHAPWLAHAFAGRLDAVTLVPIMVGALSVEREAAAAAALAPLLAEPATLFVVSTDFCHYGARFGYTPRFGAPTVAAGIESLDREGMALIEAGDSSAFRAYLTRTGNTICGRYPVSLLLATAAAVTAGGGPRLAARFIAYDQSVRLGPPPAGAGGSSVSYAAALCCAVGGG